MTSSRKPLRSLLAAALALALAYVETPGRGLLASVAAAGLVLAVVHPTYAIFLWLPFVLQADKHFTIDIYLLLTMSALSQFPGYAAAIWLVERIGRRPTLAGFLLLGGVSGYFFAVAQSQPALVAALFFVGFFNLGAWGAVYPYTSELFPTRLRSSAFGMLAGVRKAAAISAAGRPVARSITRPR